MNIEEGVAAPGRPKTRDECLTLAETCAKKASLSDSHASLAATPEDWQWWVDSANSWRSMSEFWNREAAEAPSCEVLA